MIKFSKFYFIFIASLTFAGIAATVSCSSSIKPEDTSMYASAAAIISNSYPTGFPVSVYRFTNTTKVTNVNYLARAIPDMIAASLRPTGGERAYLDFRRFPVAMPDNFAKFASVTNTIFGKFVTNLHSVLTQYGFQYVTNSNYVKVVYATNASQANQTLTFYVIQTNRISTNYTETNVAVFPDDSYVAIITNMFPKLTNTLSYIPISVAAKTTAFFKLSNMQRFSAAITGDYSAVVTGRGPSIVTVNLTMVKFLDSIDTNTNRFLYSSNRLVSYDTNTGKTNVVYTKVVTTNYYSNRLTLTLKCREDELPTRLTEWLKPIREMLLARQTGDLRIDSVPANANVYLDGVYIGNTPMLYPAVPVGTHQLSLIKTDYERLVLKADIVPDMTNFLNVEILKKASGGTIVVTNSSSNDLVFMDNTYRGTAPIVISNISLGDYHRIETIASDTNLKPYYRSFTITDPEMSLFVRPVYQPYYGNPESIRRAAWWACYGGWAATVALAGYQVYSHYMNNYYYDLYTAYNTDGYYTEYSLWDSRQKTSLTFGIISAIVSTGLTANALYRNEIYMGIWIDPAAESHAVVGFRF